MLNWPSETTAAETDTTRAWSHPGSNLMLDFHGDPNHAELVVFSDGNHHMALLDCLNAFRRENPSVGEMFYATTPPGPVVDLLTKGALRVGNLRLSISPHVFLSPPPILDMLREAGHIDVHRPFVRNRGSVLLVPKGNPKAIRNLSDLLRPDIRLFLSNPDTERVSYQIYLDTLTGMAESKDMDLGEFSRPHHPRIVFGEYIHHREAPQALVDQRADVAIVFYHLALRYTRIFPEHFDIVPLGGSSGEPQPAPGNVVSDTHVALVGDGGNWGRQFFDFLQTDEVKDIYTSHGLLPI